MEVTMEKLERLFDAKLEPINTKLAAVEETLSQHTAALDGLARDVKTVLDEKTTTAHRVERIEQWTQPVGEKLGIKLEL
jgi:response regulator RpfG family c-di-GMP phosphodiesterase